MRLFIKGQEIAKEEELQQEKQNRINDMNTLREDSFNYTNQQVSEIPVDNLLQYRGHVNTIDELPSSGQTTGTLIEPYFTMTAAYINKLQNDSYHNVADTYLKKHDNYAYFLGLMNYNVSNTDLLDRGFLNIYTDFQECIDGINFFRSKVTDCIMIHITYDPLKPVYVNFGNTYQGVLNYEDGTTETVSVKWNKPITKSCWVSCADNYYDYDKFFLIKGNLTNYIKFKQCDLEYFSQGNSQDLFSVTKYKSLVNQKDSFIYNLDYSLLTFENNKPVFATILDSFVVENDVYTVGDNKEIYRGNSNLQWEHWSKAPESSGSDDPTVYYMNLADYNTDAPEVIAVAQEIYNRISSGDKDIVVVYKTKINTYFYTNLCFYDESQSTETKIQFTGTFSIPQTQDTKEINGYTQIALYRVLFTITATDGVVTKVTRANNWADMAKVLAVSNTTQPAYMATKPWHPVSKQYADNVSKVVKQVDVLPDREWVEWDNASDLSNKTIKISNGLHNYSMMDYDPEFVGQYKTYLTSNTGYSIAIDTYDKDDEYRYAWVLLKNGSPVKILAYISEYDYEDYVVEDNILPSDAGIFTSEKLGTSEMPDALLYLGGFPQDFIYQVGTELHISIGESFVKLVTE